MLGVQLCSDHYVGHFWAHHFCRRLCRSPSAGRQQHRRTLHASSRLASTFKRLPLVASHISAFTNATLEYVSAHASSREVVRDEGLTKTSIYGSGPEGPIRFVTRQHHATRGQRDMRLFTWTHIHCPTPEAVLAAVSKASSDGGGKGAGKTRGAGGKKGWRPSIPLGPLEREELLQRAQTEPLYHEVLRGRDLEFTPPGDSAIVDVVTRFFLDAVDEMRNLIVESLSSCMLDQDGTGDSALDAFRALMADAGFTQALELYFRNGDQHREDALHLAGRLGGANCFLRRAIKEGETDLVRELMSAYTCEATQDRPWLRLAEPLLTLGTYKNTALHDAAYYGRADCLRELLVYVHERHPHLDLATLLNVEDARKKESLNPLEMAYKLHTWACFRLLEQEPSLMSCATRLREDGEVPADEHLQVDMNTRGSQQAVRLRPHLEVRVAPKSADCATAIVCCDFELAPCEEDAPASAAVFWVQFFERSVSFLEQLVLALSEAPLEEAGCGTDVSLKLPDAERQQMSMAEAGSALRGKFPEGEHGWRLALVVRNLGALTEAGEELHLRAAMLEWLELLSTRVFPEGGRVFPTRLQFRSCSAADGRQASAAWLAALNIHAKTLRDHVRPWLLNFQVFFATNTALAERESRTGVAVEKVYAPEDSEPAAIAQIAHQFLSDVVIRAGVPIVVALVCFHKAAPRDSAGGEGGGPRTSATQALSRAAMPTQMVFYLAAGSMDHTEAARFLRRLTLMGAVEDVHAHFFSTQKLLAEQPRDPLEALDPDVVEYVRLLLTAWFEPYWRTGSWEGFVGELLARAHRLGLEAGTEGVALTAVSEGLREALDTAVLSLLRMRRALGHALARARLTEQVGFLSWIEALVPMRELPKFDAKLNLYKSTVGEAAVQPTG